MTARAMTKQTPKSYAPVPREASVWRYALWLIAPICAMALVIYASLSLMSRADIPSYQSFQGVLRPGTNPVVLSLPPSSALEAILVNRGDKVRRGQTIALLDVAAMERQKTRIEETIFEAMLVRDCLVSYSSEPLVTPDSDDAKKRGNFLVEKQHSAPSECTVFVKGIQAGSIELQDRKAVLENEVSLLDHYLRLVTEKHQNETRAEGKNRALKAVSLDLARNRVKRKLIDLEREIARFEQNATQKALEMVEASNERIAENQDRLTMVSYHLKKPRIVAPATGKVLRIRPTPRELLVQAATDIVEIRSADHRGYHAQFEVPEHLASGLTPGTHVAMRFLGAGFSAPNVTGEITDLENAPNGNVLAHIGLDPESVAWLDSPNTGIALRGRSTATRVLARKVDFNPATALAQRLRTTFLPIETASPVSRMIAWTTSKFGFSPRHGQNGAPTQRHQE